MSTDCILWDFPLLCDSELIDNASPEDIAIAREYAQSFIQQITDHSYFDGCTYRMEFLCTSKCCSVCGCFSCRCTRHSIPLGDFIGRPVRSATVRKASDLSVISEGFTLDLVGCLHIKSEDLWHQYQSEGLIVDVQRGKDLDALVLSAASDLVEYRLAICAAACTFPSNAQSGYLQKSYIDLAQGALAINSVAQLKYIFDSERSAGGARLYNLASYNPPIITKLP